MAESRPTMSSAEAAIPTDSRQRIELLDVVRGFALFGVFLANFVELNTTFARPDKLLPSILDQPAEVFLHLFVTFKFFTIFSFLFGIGFAIQSARARQKQSSFLPAYLRRSSALLAFGILNLTLLWYSDILAIYAALAFLLLLIHQWSNRALLAVAALLLVVPHTAVDVYKTLRKKPEVKAGTATPTAEQRAARRAQRADQYKQASLPETVRMNTAAFRRGLLTWEFSIWGILGIFAKFIAGYCFGRSGLLEQLQDKLPLIRRLMWWSLGVGIAGHVVVVVSVGLFGGIQGTAPLWFALGFTWLIDVGIAGLALFYVCLLVVLFNKSRWRERLMRLAPLGRMALTNYLMQSVFFVVLLFGYAGFGLLGEFGTASCYVVVSVFFLFQLYFSGWWLRRYRFGPVEWLWRTITYWKLQPMRAEALKVQS